MSKYELAQFAGDKYGVEVLHWQTTIHNQFVTLSQAGHAVKRHQEVAMVRTCFKAMTSAESFYNDNVATWDQAAQTAHEIHDDKVLAAQIQVDRAKHAVKQAAAEAYKPGADQAALAAEVTARKALRTAEQGLDLLQAKGPDVSFLRLVTDAFVQHFGGISGTELDRFRRARQRPDQPVEEWGSVVPTLGKTLLARDPVTNPNGQGLFTPLTLVNAFTAGIYDPTLRAHIELFVTRHPQMITRTVEEVKREAAAQAGRMMTYQHAGTPLGGGRGSSGRNAQEVEDMSMAEAQRLHRLLDKKLNTHGGGKAGASSSAQGDKCKLHPYGNHTNAQCKAEIQEGSPVKDGDQAHSVQET